MIFGHERLRARRAASWRRDALAGRERAGRARPPRLLRGAAAPSSTQPRALLDRWPRIPLPRGRSSRRVARRRRCSWHASTPGLGRGAAAPAGRRPGLRAAVAVLAAGAAAAAVASPSASWRRVASAARRSRPTIAVRRRGARRARAQRRPRAGRALPERGPGRAGRRWRRRRRDCDRGERARWTWGRPRARSRELLARRALLVELGTEAVASAQPVLDDVEQILREVASLESCVRRARRRAGCREEMERRQLLMQDPPDDRGSSRDERSGALRARSWRPCSSPRSWSPGRAGARPGRRRAPAQRPRRSSSTGSTPRRGRPGRPIALRPRGPRGGGRRLLGRPLQREPRRARAGAAASTATTWTAAPPIARWPRRRGRAAWASPRGSTRPAHRQHLPAPHGRRSPTRARPCATSPRCSSPAWARDVGRPRCRSSSGSWPRRRTRTSSSGPSWRSCAAIRRPWPRAAARPPSRPPSAAPRAQRAGSACASTRRAAAGPRSRSTCRWRSADLVFKSLPDDARAELRQEGLRRRQLLGAPARSWARPRSSSIEGDDGERVQIWIE